MLSEQHAQIQDAFHEHGVQIMSPHFEGQPRATVTVPRERWRATPAGAEGPASPAAAAKLTQR